jgi:hypothetical protein
VFNKDSVRYTRNFLENAAGKGGDEGRFSGENGKPTIYSAHENGALLETLLKESL